nr:MAG TPA: hypothetical protein [Caudoviricetes sp.]
MGGTKPALCYITRGLSVGDVEQTSKCGPYELESIIFAHRKVLGQVSIVIELIRVGQSVAHATSDQLIQSRSDNVELAVIQSKTIVHAGRNLRQLIQVEPVEVTQILDGAHSAINILTIAERSIGKNIGQGGGSTHNNGLDAAVVSLNTLAQSNHLLGIKSAALNELRRIGGSGQTSIQGGNSLLIHVELERQNNGTDGIGQVLLTSQNAIHINIHGDDMLDGADQDVRRIFLLTESCPFPMRPLGDSVQSPRHDLDFEHVAIAQRPEIHEGSKRAGDISGQDGIHACVDNSHSRNYVHIGSQHLCRSWQHHHELLMLSHEFRLYLFLIQVLSSADAHY